MKDYTRPQHELLVEMLEEHDALPSVPALSCYQALSLSGMVYDTRTMPFQWFEPIVAIKPERIFIDAGSRVDSFCKIEGGEGVHLGKCIHVASFCHLGIGGGALIAEDGSAFSSGCKVITGSARPEGLSMSACVPPEDQVVIKYTTRIGRNAAVLAGAIVLPGLTIGEGAIVAAGAVVTKSVPAFELWAGVPARRIGWKPGHTP